MQKLTSIYKEISEASTQYGQLNWILYTTGIDQGVEPALQKVLSIFKDKKNFDIICTLKDSRLNDLDKRRVEIAFKDFRSFHLSPELNQVKDAIISKSTELSKVLNTHRNQIDGKEVNGTYISEVLASSDDEALRKKAYLSRASVNKKLVDAGFLELIKLRKEYAILSGENDFVSLRLKESELSKELFKSWSEITRKYLPNRLKNQREFGKKFLKREELKPWDLRYLESKIAPFLNTNVDIVSFLQPLTKLYSYFDFDLNKMNITFDVFPRKNKSEWGYQFTITPGKDSRILANVDNKYHNYFVLLHEAGHAVHYNNIDADDHILNDGISGIISEGIANLFGYMANQEIFFKDFFEEKIADARTQFALLNQWSKMNLLSAVEPILFDHELYQQNLSSLDDINHLKTKMALELNGIPDCGYEPNWAYLIHHTTHPIYLHNYFMGDITCEMLKKIFCEKNSVESITEKPKEFGAFLLNDVIRVSGRHRFEDLFEKISGRKFSLDLLID